ncbi:MAG: prefoldin subunit alpha [Thermoplasmatota archaeon]
MNQNEGGSRSRDMEMGLAQMEQLKAQVDNLSMQRDSLRSVLADYDRSLEVLEGMKDGVKGEILIPVGGQVFIRASITDNEKCLVDQGVGVMMDRDIPSAIDQIRERKDRIVQGIAGLERSIQDLMSRYRDISERTQQLYNDQMQDSSGPENTF